MSLFLEVVLSLVRYGLGVAFGALVARQIISPELLQRIQSEGALQIATWIVTVAVPFAWIWLKNSNIIKKIEGGKQ